MKIAPQIKSDLVQMAIRWAFVVVPTIVIGTITLVFVNDSYTSFNTSLGAQSVYFGMGLTLSFALYHFRVRWIFTFILLWILYWLVGKIIVKLPGEFDVFYASAMYQLYSVIFLFGWLFGFLLQRVRYAYILLFGILAVVTLIAVSNTIDVSLQYILVNLVPVFLYGLYMLFVSPIMTEKVEMDMKKSGKLAIRFAIFILLVFLAFIVAEMIFSQDLKAVEKELIARGVKDSTEGQYDDRYGLMDRKGGGLKMKDSMKMDSRMSQSDNLMFISKLNNFFPDGSPQPLYLVYHYLTKYDAAKETFVRDIAPPSFDEFDFDPSTLEMFHAQADTSMIRKAMGNKLRKVVETEIYLASGVWKHALLAPATAFYCQAIPVEKDFQKQFKSAYKVKSYASELNNAFYVYNPSASPQLEEYQEERNELLRKITDYNNVDPKFYSYYTQIPTGLLYDSITRLSQGIAAGLDNPADKVLAVRSFFLQRGEDGKRIFRYTLKPGSMMDPNIPTASMLGNFLFKTHAGYCTYYAGASLLMLRSLGIPSRFTTGFVTVNRSDKNKGWYWYYASQAHAWTQVYFPGYGWMDFDMTIGNEDQQNAPRPDGTPPLPPPEPWLVVNGVAAKAADVTKKSVDVTFSNIIYFNDNYALDKDFTRTFDASVCRVVYDKKDTTLACIIPGDSLIVVSYLDEAKKIPIPRRGVKIETQIDGFPRPIVADEIHIKSREKEKKNDDVNNQKKKEVEKPIDWKKLLATAGITLAGAILLIFLLPLLYLVYRSLRTMLASNPNDKADHVYREALYRFHMAGIERGGETPLELAREKADPAFQAGFEEFMHIYLRLKYGSGSLESGDQEAIDRFARNVRPAIAKQKGFFSTYLGYFNLLLASRYFVRGEENETENQTQSI